MIDITKTFPGVVALDKAKLEVREGSVHSLMGENGAGKSTLMKCLFGVYIEDSGNIYISGEKVNFKNSKQALENGVAMVHQELNQVLEQTVMDNIWLGRFPTTGGIINKKKMYEDTKKIFEELNLNIKPDEKISKLSVSQRQMIEIAKAYSYNAKILVLDEPTSSLTEEEVKRLFEIIDKLKKKGCGIIYISHKMEEILKISDDVTIMRDGKWIATEKAENLDIDKIIKLMVGRDMTHRFPDKINKPKDTILDVRNLTSFYAPGITNVSFDLRKGEILGVAGLVGSGRTELLETLFGIKKIKSGEITLHSRKIENSNPRQAIRNGFALLTEERRSTGIFGGLSIKFNSVISNIKGYSKFGYLNDQKMEKDTKWVIDSMNVKTPSQKTQIKTLSGGNQQKVILGRWLLTDPEILMLDEPTRGIDVGAKFEIYQLILELASRDKAVIMVSSEMTELLGICDRIAVMSNGQMAGIIENDENITQEEILKLASKYL
ncbi:MAG: galactose/methyl galactoside ABC transporter ATP-binding protein MglA [Ruminococcaceae bacterium]|nr:galactose/methyl galactoside ABC transporter ATP-binding protein MglA [Oscillospiraceae bacterium]